jgi:glycosyltransferase involved in cell wall biosynthesis
MAKFKVLQVAPAYYPAISIGGPIFSMLHLTNALLECDCVVDVLSTPLGLSVTKENSSIILGEKQQIDSGHSIIYFPYYGYKHFTFSPQTFLWALKNVNKYNIIILNGVWNFPFLATAFACWVNKVPYYVIPHGNIYKTTVELKSSFLKNIFIAVFIRQMFKRAEKILFTTTNEQNEVSEFLNIEMNSFVLPNIVDSKNYIQLPKRGEFRSKFGIDLDSDLLIHFGRISKKKGIEYTIESLVELKKTRPNIKFAIVGGDEEGYKSEIERLIKKNNLTSNVFFTGLLTPEDGIQALVDSDIFVLPSLSENFGMSVVEAMYCGLPVVISEYVGIAEDISKAEAGIVVGINDGNLALINALNKLLSNHSFRNSIGTTGRDFALNHYDIPVSLSNINFLLSTLK